MKTIYLTGISGFLGRNIVLKLLEKGDVKIVGLVLPNEKNLDIYLKDNITLIEGNILNKEDVEKFLSYPGEDEKYLIHAAGSITTIKKGDPITMKINVEGTQNVIDASINKNFKKVIYISSVDAIAKRKGNEEIFEPETFDVSLVDGVYSKSKVIASNYVLDAYQNKGLNAVILCPSAIMGPNDPFHAPINDAIKKFLIDKLPAITKGGYNIVDVRDVASGVLSSLENARNGETYILSGEYISVKDLIGLAAKISNKKPVTFLVPHLFIKIISPFVELVAKIKKKKPLFTGFSMDCLMQNSNYSYAKANKELGYQPTDIKQSMIDTISWMKESDYLL